MLVTNTNILNALQSITGINSYYELFADSQMAKPCITYMETTNADNLTAESFGYSNIGYTVKLWTTDYTDIATYAPQIDNKMRQLGFSRQSATELVVGNQISKVYYYTALAKENY